MNFPSVGREIGLDTWFLLPAEAVRVTPRDGRLHVEITPESGHRAVPSLADVAALRKATVQRWAQFLGTYGVPFRDDRWRAVPEPVGKDAWRWRAVLEPVGEDAWREVYEISLVVLRGVADRAALLIASNDALRGKPQALQALLDEGLQKGPVGEDFKTVAQEVGASLAMPYLGSKGARPSTDEDFKTVAQEVVRQSLREALNGMVPRAVTSERSTTWRFYAEGWWPFALLAFLVPARLRLSPTTDQRCKECGRRIPNGRVLKHALYCSERCSNTRKRRDNRARHRARQAKKAETGRAITRKVRFPSSRGGGI